MRWYGELPTVDKFLYRYYLQGEYTWGPGTENDDLCANPYYPGMPSKYLFSFLG